MASAATRVFFLWGCSSAEAPASKSQCRLKLLKKVGWPRILLKGTPRHRLVRFCGSSAEQSIQGTGGEEFLKVAGVIGTSTAISKILGLVRELVLAAAFGLGPVVDAFGYASIIPGFFLTVLGGINGPLHVTMVAALSKVSDPEGKELSQKVSSSILLVSMIFCILLCIFSGGIIDAFAPGLRSSGSTGSLTRRMAILQLRMTAPSIVLACLMGVGYGRLSAAGNYGLASLSPALSSISMICAAGLYSAFYSVRCAQGHDLMAGCIFLAVASTMGVLAQWFMQVAVEGPTLLSLRWINPFRDNEVKQVLALMIPAAVSSGMLQLATYTDLYFASYFPQAAAALGYANLLVMAPLGIISSAVLIPMLPIFSRLSEPRKWPELRARIRQGIQLCMTLTLPMTALMVPLAKPIVCILFQRYAFDTSAAEAVSSLVICYVLGSTFYLVRDLLVRVSYSLGDSQMHFYISMAAIAANAVLDWLLVSKAGFGPEGLVMATSTVNFLSAVALWQVLSSKIQDVSTVEWTRSLLSLLGCAVITSGITAASYKWLHRLLLPHKASWVKELVRVGLSSSVGAVTFLSLLMLLQGEQVQKLLKELHELKRGAA